MRHAELTGAAPVGFLLSGEHAMKNVLCFGDSNTYGYDPAGMRDGTAVRYAQDVR